MRSMRALVIVSMVIAAGYVMAGQALVSSMGNVNAVMEANGFRIVPVYDMIQVASSSDQAQPQVFEIIRPGAERIAIGRMNTSCSCVQLEATKPVFERGERAFLTLRNVRETPPNGQHYAFYVQIVSPIRTTLRADTFVQSDRFRYSTQTAPVSAVVPIQHWNSSMR